MIIGLTILLVVLVLYPIYVTYVDKDIEISHLETQKSERQGKLDKITEIQAQFAGTGSSEIRDRVKKYDHAYNTSDIMEAVMVNKFTKSTTLTPASINIGSINIDKGKKLPNWLSMANISLAVSGDTSDQIIDYITYLATESKFAFTIDSITLPIDTTVSEQDGNSIALNISLWVYYYE